MSEHFIEDIVAEAVHVLGAHDGGEDVRDLFFTLWWFQAGHDCGFTQGRVLETLVAHRYTYRLPLSAHPAHAAHATSFAAAAKDPREIAFVDDILGEDPPDDEERQEVLGSEAGYVLDGHLHCDAGTPLWKDLVDAGVLGGRDATTPRHVPFLELASRVMHAAEKANDRALVKAFYALGPSTLLGHRFSRDVKKGDLVGKNPFTGEPIVANRPMTLPRDPSPEEAAALPEVAALRDLVRRSKAMDASLHHDVIPPPEGRSELEAWWYDV